MSGPDVFAYVVVNIESPWREPNMKPIKVALIAIASLLVGVTIGVAGAGGGDVQQPTSEAQPIPTVVQTVPGPTVTVPGPTVTVPGPTKTVPGPAVTKTVRPRAPKTSAAATIDGDGIYLVGKDIQPGTYKSSGDGYWARLSDVGGELEDIITNGLGTNQLVKIHSTDKAFETSGYDHWTKVS